MANEYITAGEFTRWRTEETEFRKGIKSDLGEILGLVRAQNGRVASTEACIQVIRRDIEAIKSDDGEIDKTVKDIQKHGCRQLERHADLLNVGGDPALTQAEERHERIASDRAPWSLRHLSQKQKLVASAGITALVIPAVSDLFKLGVAFLGWLSSQGVR